MARKPRRTSAVEKKLVGVADVVITAAQRYRDPTLAIPVRSLSNVTFNERKGLLEMGKRRQARSFFNVGMAKKFMQTVLVADALCELQRADLTTSLRGIYLRTGNGQPPRGVRRVARRLHEEKRLPVYVLVDNDPWGYYIYSVIKQGSINLAFESQRMAIPKAKFIGLSSGDPESYGLPRNVGIKLNDKDIARARELLSYTWFAKKPWQEEIKRMLASGLKYELDALANKDFQYLTKRYLPRKLKEKDWLD